MTKRIKHRKTPPNHLILKREEGVTTDGDVPLFCFKHIQKGFDISDCTKDEKTAFANFLSGIGNKTWGEIKKSPRTGLGYEKIFVLNVTLPECVKNKTVISFRGSGIMRIIGYREQSILYILWIDTKGKAYSH